MQDPISLVENNKIVHAYPTRRVWEGVYKATGERYYIHELDKDDENRWYASNKVVFWEKGGYSLNSQAEFLVKSTENNPPILEFKSFHINQHLLVIPFLYAFKAISNSKELCGWIEQTKETAGFYPKKIIGEVVAYYLEEMNPGGPLVKTFNSPPFWENETPFHEVKCDCGGETVGTTHSLWCSTMEG